MLPSIHRLMLRLVEENEMRKERHGVLRTRINENERMLEVNKNEGVLSSYDEVCKDKL